MRSVPPDSKTLDSSWGLDEVRTSSGTPNRSPRRSSSRSPRSPARRMAHRAWRPPAGTPCCRTARARSRSRRRSVSDYVAKMMTRRSHSSSEITAQRPRPPEAFPPKVPARPPPRGRSLGAATRLLVPRANTALPAGDGEARPGCDEPRGPVAARRADGVRIARRRARLRGGLDDDLLRRAEPVVSAQPGEIDVFGGPPVDARDIVPPAAKARGPRPDDGGSLGIDFRLDLGFEEPGPPMMDRPPDTPLPGALRDGPARGGRRGRVPRRDQGARRFDLVQGLGRAQGAARAAPIRDRSRACGHREGRQGVHSRAAEPTAERPGAAGADAAPVRSGRFRRSARPRGEPARERPKDWMARQYADSCVEMLRQMYQSRLGGGCACCGSLCPRISSAR